MLLYRRIKMNQRFTSVWRTIYAAMVAALVVSTALVGCLNPISFNPEDFPTIKVTGEIAIDNINSAELQFRNHTKSVDIYKIDINQERTIVSTIIDNSSLISSQTDETILDARISGSPKAGTQDSILVRPTGSNISDRLIVKKYNIIISYKKALPFSSGLPIFSVYDSPPPLEINIEELPRGRCVIHIYRNKAGEIVADVETISNDPEYEDYHHDSDFIEDNNLIINNNMILNINDIIVDIKSLPPVEVNLNGLQDFSDMVKQEISNLHIKLDEIKDLLSMINASMITLGDYLNDGNILLLRLTEGIEEQNTLRKQYGSLTVYNGLPVQIQEVKFAKLPSDINPELKSFEITNISPQSIKGPSLNGDSSNIYVLAGNYYIAITANNYTTYIGEFKVEDYISNPSTKLNIYAGPAPTHPLPGNIYLNTTLSPPLNYYLAYANGSNNQASDTIYLEFNDGVMGLTLSDIAITNDTGDITKINLMGSGKNYQLGIAVNTAGHINLKINKNGIDDSIHKITVYLPATPPPPPVITTRYIFKQAGIDAVVTTGSGESTILPEIPYQRKTNHYFDWWLKYDVVTYSNGGETARTTVTKNRPGAFIIDSSNNGNYITHTATGQLWIKDWVSGSYIAGDKPSAVNWLFHTAIDWGESMDGHIIEGMPYMTSPLYLGPFQIGTRKIYGLDVNVRVTN